jgi:hypothetical protein
MTGLSLWPMKKAGSQRVTLRIWNGCWFVDRGRETSTG